MKRLNTTVTYSSSTPEDSLWVRLEQEGIDDDTAILEDTAELLDEVYNIDACSEESTATDPDEDSVEEAVDKVFDYSICGSDYEGNIDVRIRVVRSDPSLTYNVYVSDGEILRTESITDVITSEVFVNAGTSIILDYPVISGGVFSWSNDLVSEGETIISRNGSVLYWRAQASGTIKCSYTTAYDVLNIKVYGVDGEYGKATVRVVYQGEIGDLETEVPDAYDDDRSPCGFSSEVVDNQTVTCYRTVVKTQKCSCSKEVISSETHDEVVGCPDYAPKKCPGASSTCSHFLGTFAEIEYVDCPEDNIIPGSSLRNMLSDPEYYKDTCCVTAAVKLPDCEIETLSYKGGKSISPSEAYYSGLYGTRTRFVPVSNEGGCGEHRIVQDVKAESCCDTIPPLTWDAASSIDILQANDDGYVYVLEGLGPFSWRIISTRGYVWFRDSGTGTLATDEATRWAALVSGDYPCGTYTIEVTDACGITVSGEVTANNGTWTLLMSPSSKSDWTVDEFEGALYSLPVSPALIQSSTIIADESNQKLLSVVIKDATETYKVEQYIGVIWWHLWDTTDSTMIMPCFPTAHEIVPSDFPFPTAIPTTVWPAEPLTYDGGNGSGIAPGHPYYVPDSVLHYNGIYYDGACIWTNKPTWSDYSPLTRRVVKDLSALEFLTADSNLPTTDFYSQIPDEPEMLWAYTRTFGGDGYYDCCSAGEYCYEEYFGFLIYGQTLRVYGYNC